VRAATGRPQLAARPGGAERVTLVPATERDYAQPLSYGVGPVVVERGASLSATVTLTAAGGVATFSGGAVEARTTPPVAHVYSAWASSYRRAVVVTVPDTAGRWVATLGTGVRGGALGDWVGARVEEMMHVQGLKEIGAVVGFLGAVRIFNRLSRPAE
jgi:hypothetical protein